MKKRSKWFRTLVRQRFFIILLLFLQLVFIIFFLADQSQASVIIKWTLQVISFFVALHIIAKRDKGAYKLTWVFTILVFPIFGGLLYLLFRYQTRSKKLRIRMNHITNITRPAALLPGDKHELAIKSPASSDAGTYGPETPASFAGKQTSDFAPEALSPYYEV